MALKKIKLPDNSVVEVQDARIPGVDSTPTSESANIVTSGGVYDALADSRITGKIFHGTCSTAAATTDKVVVCPEFTSADFEKVGTVIFVTFDYTNTGAVGSLTLNVNGTGALSIKKVYSATTANLTAAGELRGTMTYPFCRTGSYWMCMGLDYNTNDTLAYQIRNNTSSRAASDAFVQYRLLFSSADDTKWVPANTSTSTNATAARAVNQTPINPFGPIVYYSSTTAIAAGSRPGPTSTYTRYPSYVLGYSFNRTGAALTLTAWKPVYLKCAPQADGSAIMDGDQPIVQAFPTTADGKIYIFLGVAYDATHIEFYETHPIYYYRNGTIKLWTNDAISPDIAVTKQNDQEFTARTTGNGIVGDASIGKISKILGKSLAWNQFLKEINSTNYTVSGKVTIDNGNFLFTGTGTGYYENISIAPSIRQTIYSGRKYLFCGYVSNNTLTTQIERFCIGKAINDVYAFFVLNKEGFLGTIFSPSKTEVMAAVGFAASSSINIPAGETCAVGNIMLFDLTLMFGAGNEPATVEEFEQLYPLEYYDYNAGTLINNAATALKTTSSDAEWTLPLNLTTITGKLNGEGSSVTIFPDGLKSVVSVYDEISGADAIVRIGKKILDGTETYTMAGRTYMKSDATDVYVLVNDIAPSDGVTRAEIKCSHLRPVNAAIWQTVGYPNTIVMNYSAGSKQVHLNIANSSAGIDASTDTSTTAKQKIIDYIAAQYNAGTPITIYYKLATPKEYTLDESLSLGYKCDGHGTEERLPADTASSVLAPFKADIQYGLSEGELYDSLKSYVDEQVVDSKITGKIFRGVCQTAAATAAKEVICPDFTEDDFVPGVVVLITFSETNTAAVSNLTLNVNNTGVKNLRKEISATVTSLTQPGELRVGLTYMFVYNGVTWVCMTLDNDTTYDTMSQGELDSATVEVGRLLPPRRLRWNFYKKEESEAKAREAIERAVGSGYTWSETLAQTTAHLKGGYIEGANGNVNASDNWDYYEFQLNGAKKIRFPAIKSPSTTMIGGGAFYDANGTYISGFIWENDTSLSDVIEVERTEDVPAGAVTAKIGNAEYHGIYGHSRKCEFYCYLMGGDTVSDMISDYAVQAVNTCNKIWAGTQAQYDLLTPDSDTLYLITGQ